MNYNNNNNELNNYPWYLDIPHPQLYYSFSANQSHPIIPEQQPQQQQQEEEQSQQQQEKQRNKSRGNRKLQRYRRKLRKQEINADAMAHSTRASINIELSKSCQIEQPNIETTSILVAQPVFPPRTITAKKYKQNKQPQRRNTMLKKKTNSSRIRTMGPMQLSATTTDSSKNTSTTTNTTFDSTDVSDQTLYEMLLKAFNGDTEKLTHYLNGSQNIQFVREYTNLISCLSSIKLKQSQWNWYHHIGITRNIWTTRIPKHIAQKNSICYTYGRSRRIIEQRRQKIQQQLQETQNALQLFEQQLLSKSVYPVHCCSEIQALSSILRTFIDEHKQKLRDELEYKRQELILDATDHQLVQQFFSLKPMKSQVKIKRILFCFFE